MCAIGGVVGRGAAAHVDSVAQMLACMHHRGPDGDGIEVFDHAVIGTARLAVVDLPGGSQPICSPGRQEALVANGEIYGYRRLRAELREYPFQTNGDVEVALALHRRHGDSFLEHLPGTFALGLWDEAARTLTLARDRFGERPLYWATTRDGLLVFASELKALVRSGLIGVALDREVVAHVLRQGYVPSGRCIWAGAHSLGHAERLRWSQADGVRIDRWWSAPPVQADEPNGRHAAAWFRSELERSVAEQLEADVPVGTFLSGGVDSSTIAAIAGRHRPGLPAFAFDMPGDSEVEYAELVAARHGLALHVCRPGDVDVADALLDLSRIWDEPFGDSSAIPTAMLARFARREVTVALTGDGADELLGGYLCWTRGLLDPGDPARLPEGPGVPDLAGRRWSGLRDRRPFGRSSAIAGADERGRAEPALAQRYAAFRQYFSADDLLRLGLPALSAASVDVSRYATGTADDMCRFDLDHYLPGDILVKSDRASMATGLEVRAPFLDSRLAAGCMALPASSKVDSRREKILLREACGDLLPTAVQRRPKQGFGAPMARWLTDPKVVELRRAHLSDPSAPLFDIVDHEAVQGFVDVPDQALWNLLTLALWWQEHRLAPVA